VIINRLRDKEIDYMITKKIDRYKYSNSPHANFYSDSIALNSFMNAAMASSVSKK